MYSIGAVGRMVELSPGVLRSWEDRYGVIVPARSGGGQRLYSRDQVDQLRFIRHLMQTGAHAADAHRVLAQRLAEGATPLPADANTPKVSVLLADRDIYSAELLEYLLRNEGYEVTVALDADDASSLYSQRSFDLVFIDLVISGGIGSRLCRELSELGARVVAVSSLDLSGAAIEAGASAFLRKPLDSLQVLSTTKDLLIMTVAAYQQTADS